MNPEAKQKVNETIVHMCDFIQQTIESQTLDSQIKAFELTTALSKLVEVMSSVFQNEEIIVEGLIIDVETFRRIIENAPEVDLRKSSAIPERLLD